MYERISCLNKVQLDSKKPFVDKETAHFEWEDKGLLSLLVDGQPPLECRRYSVDSHQEEENLAVKIANNIMRKYACDYDLVKLEVSFSDAIDSARGYLRERLCEIEFQVVKNAKMLKGLLIYGEGGIGKTRFLYDLCLGLEEKGRPFAACFNQGAFAELDSIGLRDFKKLAQDGCTLVVDACNELEEDAFVFAAELISEALKAPKCNVIVSTRSESPTSRIHELQSLIPASIEFEGVNPYRVYDALSESSDELIIQFQDMLFSRNPRNLNAVLKKLKKFNAGDGPNRAAAQRSSMVESSIKDALTRKSWLETKSICKCLLKSSALDFSKEDADSFLGYDSSRYLAEMLEQGFIQHFEYDGIRYSFTSESQIRFVIARSLNDELDQIDEADLDEDKLAESVAKITASKCSFINDYEVVQVCVDRYLSRGPSFLAKLLKALEDNGQEIDLVRLFTQTIFPADWDFESFNAKCFVDTDWAILNFAGLANTPFNLTHCIQGYLFEKPSTVDAIFRKAWDEFTLHPLISRLQNITDYVSHTGRVLGGAKDEWVWLSIWCSFASNMKLRALSQRLMFFLADSDPSVADFLIEAWPDVHDVYARRAIAKTLAHLSIETRCGDAVEGFLDRVVDDPEITDSIVISYLCKTSGGKFSPVDFSAKNYHLAFGDIKPSKKDIDCFIKQVNRIDLHLKGYLPLNVYTLGDGLDFGYSARFISADTSSVADWNRSLSALLKCPQEGDCKGLVVRHDDFDEVLPVNFDIRPLDKKVLLDCAVVLADKWLHVYGGTLDDLLGTFVSVDTRTPSLVDSNYKPFDLAIHELLGSLSANYYIDEIVLGGEGFNSVGFAQYEETAEQEPGVIHTCSASADMRIDTAKAKIERRLVSPLDKERTWFNDTGEALIEIKGLIESLRLGRVEWVPLAFSVKKRVHSDSELQCSNEIIVSIAINSEKHICGCSDDRYLTIEHDSYEGNTKDFGKAQGSNCVDLEAPDRRSVSVERNNILLPPPTLVDMLGLSFNPRNACFERDDEAVILCDGNPGNYYVEPVHNLILIRRDVLEEVAQTADLRYFAFTERYQEEFGYDNACDRHWELDLDGNELASYPNNGGANDPQSSPACLGCRFSSANRERESEENATKIQETIDSLLRDYGSGSFAD